MKALNGRAIAELEPPEGRFDPDAPIADFDAPSNDSGVIAVVAATPLIALLDGPAIAEPLPEIEYLVKELGLVAGGGAPHLVAGYGFSLKTLACQSAVVSLTAGRAVWGAYNAGRRVRVVHVDLEQGARLTRRRYQRLARAQGIDLAELGDALTLADMPRIALTVDHFDTWRELMTGRDLVLIDSLRAATGGQDENSSDIRAGLDLLGTISNETGCRPLLIHHSRKPTEGAPGGAYAIRGSGAIFDACDAAYLFSAMKGEPVRVENVKSRSHGELVEDVALVVEDVEIDGDPRAGLRIQVHGSELLAQRHEERQQDARREQAERDATKVRDALTQSPGIGTKELRGVSRLSGDRLAAALLHLGDAVEVQEEAKGRTRVSRHYLRGAR